MHPDPRYRAAPPVSAAARALVAQEGWGMVIASGESVAESTGAEPLHVQHVPVVMHDDGSLRFHLSNAGPLVPGISGSRALMVVNGPHGYVSPHWYPVQARHRAVPTWDYVALEAEGVVVSLDRAALRALLADIAAQEEARLAPAPCWTADACDGDHYDRLLGGISGFALFPDRLVLTEKLHQTKDQATRMGVAAALDAVGNPALAARVRAVAS